MKIEFFQALCAAILLSVAPALADGWTTNYAAALDKAKTENKAVLLDFTGSDWCPWCVKMKRETLDTGRFKEYADKNLVLVEVDFPNSKPQSDAVRAQNQQLKQQFNVHGFPSFLILNSSGQELGRQVGYLAGGPSAFIAELGKFYKPAAGSGGSSTGDDFDAFFKKPAQSPTP